MRVHKYNLTATTSRVTLGERDQRFAAAILNAIPQEVETTLAVTNIARSRHARRADLEIIAMRFRQQANQLQSQVNKLSRN